VGLATGWAPTAFRYSVTNDELFTRLTEALVAREGGLEDDAATDAPARTRRSDDPTGR
jgi:hypothetical protein